MHIGQRVSNKTCFLFMFIRVGRELCAKRHKNIRTLDGSSSLQILVHFYTSFGMAAIDELASLLRAASLKLVPKWYADFTEKIPLGSKCQAGWSSIPLRTGIARISLASSGQNKSKTSSSSQFSVTGFINSKTLSSSTPVRFVRGLLVIPRGSHGSSQMRTLSPVPILHTIHCLSKTIPFKILLQVYDISLLLHASNTEQCGK